MAHVSKRQKLGCPCTRGPLEQEPTTRKCPVRVAHVNKPCLDLHPQQQTVRVPHRPDFKIKKTAHEPRCELGFTKLTYQGHSFIPRAADFEAGRLLWIFILVWASSARLESSNLANANITKNSQQTLWLRTTS